MGAVSNWLLVLVLASSFSFAITYVNSIGNPGFENFICQGTLNCENFGDEETCNLYAEYSCFFEEGRCLTGGDPDCGSYGIPDAETCQALQCSWDSDFWVPAISGCSGCSVWPSDAGTKNSGVYSAITNSSGVSSNGYVQIYQSLPYSPLALNVSNFTNANSRLTAYGLWRKAASGGNDTLVFQINSTKSKAINYVWGATGLSNVSGVVCNYEMGSLPGTWTAFLNTNFYRDWVNCPGFTFDDQLKNLSLYSNGVSTPVGQDFNWDDLLLNHSDKAKPPVFVENIANTSTANPGDQVIFSSRWRDDDALSSGILSWTGSGNCLASVNNSEVITSSGTSNWFNVTKIISGHCEGFKLTYQFYANGSENKFVGSDSAFILVNSVAPVVSGTAVNDTLVFGGDMFCVNATITEAGILSQGAVNVTVNYPNGTVTNMSLTNSSGGAGSCTVGGNVWGRSILAGSTTGNITINKTWASDRPFTGSNLGVQNANLNVTVTEMLSYSFVLQEVGEGECANGLIVGDSTEPPGSPESGAIEFIYVASGASGTQTDIEPCFKDVACCQNSGSSIPIFTMSNTGNAVIDWKLSFNSTLPSWASVRCGKSEDSGSAFDVSTSAVSIVAIPVSGIENLYCWADFNAAPAGGSSRLLIHNSTA